MIGTQDISSRFALDAQSVDNLRLQAKRDPDAALKTVAQQFEGIFLNMMLKSMREASPKGELFDSQQSEMYTQLFDQQLSQKLSTTRGVGLADMMVKQLTRSATAITPAQLTQPPQVAPAAQQPVAAPLAPEPVKPALDASAATFDSPRDFVDKLWPHAVEAGKALGVPPHFLLGQAALESGWGKRAIRGADGRDSLNLFGIKAGSKWTGAAVAATTTEYLNGQPQSRRENFRAYASYEQGFRDYVNTLSANPRYREVFSQNLDAAGFAQALQQAGYATDPMYASKLARVVNGETMRQALAG